MGIVYVVVYFRYKSLIPFMYLLVLVEYLGRIGIGLGKPLEVSHTPPGAIGDYVLVPLAIIMLLLSLKRPKKSIKFLVDRAGFEPATSALRRRRSCQTELPALY
jgi:hypothetical protein